ncbi:MAG: hypothetical protein ACFFAN_06535 [Promethearchaeota archaeon]
MLKTYFFCLEVREFQNIPIKYENEERFRLYNTGLPITKSTLINNDLKQQIENSLRKLILDVNIVALYVVRFHFGKKFTYLIIKFNSELDEIVQKFIILSTKPQPHEELLGLLENISGIIILSYYMTEYFLNRNIEQYIEQEFIKEIYSKGLEYNSNLSFEIIKIHPFLVELCSQFNLDFENLIKTSIELYFNENFPRLIEGILIRVIKFDFCLVFEADNGVTSESLCTILLEKVSKNIGRLYDSHKFPLIEFRRHLVKVDNPIQYYDAKVLESLEFLFRELKSLLYDHFPKLFHWRLDVLMFEPESASNIQRLELYEPFIQNVLYPKKRLERHLQLLEEELNLCIGKVNQIKLKKEDRIKKYGREELEEKLRNIADESEFQDILADILKDLGFLDVTINCGRRGFDEFGKDIVFFHRNKFHKKEWDAIVVKTGKIDQPEGRNLRGYIKEIIQKGSDALDIPFRDEKGIKFPITRVFVATNEKITIKAKESIRAKIEGSIFFIEKSTLMNLF